MSRPIEGAAKIGILVASALAAGIGAIILVRLKPSTVEAADSEAVG